jgi:hypothetical protein
MYHEDAMRFSPQHGYYDIDYNIADKNEPEALAEFVRRAKNRLTPQAHGNEN